MSDIVEKIKESVDIVEFISQYVQLKKRGSSYFGLCPFHHEKTPSFSVNPKGFFHCFGCGESGDVITFLMKIENLEFKEAIRELARKYDIHVDFGERSKNDYLLEIHSLAVEYFYDKLKQNRVALEYLVKRSIQGEIIDEFKIGFAPDSSELEKLLLSKGFSQEQLLQSGIFVKGYRGLFNRFSGRLIFPIQNESGVVVAFGGRIIGDDKNKAKYINSPETPIFSKQKILFGFYSAKSAMKKQRKVIITEGYMDCLRLKVSGIDNAVATLGTALSKFHVSLVSRYADEVYLNYDSDEAGFNAMTRSAPMILSSRLRAFAVILEKGEDPDSFIRKYSKEAYIKKLSQAKEYFDYIVDFLSDKYDIEQPTEKLKALEELRTIIMSVSNPFVKAAYISKISKIFNVSESVFNSKTVSFDFLSSLTKEEVFLSIILRDIELLAWIENLEEFGSELSGVYRDLYFKLVNLYLSGNEFNISELERDLSDAEKQLAYRLLSLTETDIEERYERRKVLLYLIAQFKIDNLKKRLKEIQEKIMKQPDESSFKEYDKIFHDLKGVMNDWKHD